MATALSNHKKLARLATEDNLLFAPLMPRAVTRRPRADDRRVINGMIYKIRTGLPWRDLPDHYGPRQTVYTRFRRDALSGVFTQVLQQIQAQADAPGDIDRLVQIDSTIVRAHQHAAATGRKGGRAGRTNRTVRPSVDHAEAFVLAAAQQAPR
ncbi:transposase [Streptomyces shenzhenensis]|uniref:transposase n=1 Tax=Streptomyces shenzhenensis TaxID=943815 RepID=UPI0015F0399B|nr:transposase [Streptomyces shenzhenensis]